MSRFLVLSIEDTYITLVLPVWLGTDKDEALQVAKDHHAATQKLVAVFEVEEHSLNAGNKIAQFSYGSFPELYAREEELDPQIIYEFLDKETWRGYTRVIDETDYNNGIGQSYICKAPNQKFFKLNWWREGTTTVVEIDSSNSILTCEVSQDGDTRQRRFQKKGN